MTGELNSDPHKGLHSDQGAERGEHRGRLPDPVVKVVDLAWLKFVKPDLDRAETFARDFGFLTTERTPDLLRLRGVLPGTDCLMSHRETASRFVGPCSRPPPRPPTLTGSPAPPAERSATWRAAAGA